MTIQEISLKGLLSKWGLPPKPCDSCNSSPALLFCLPHSASLCLPCDADLHSRAASPHPRVSMCDVCEQSPACVTCKADSASLCASCDREIHDANPLAARHHRLPVLPFLDSVSATDTSAFLIPDDVDSFLEVNQHLPDGRIYGADSVVPIQTTKSNNLNNRFEVDFAQSKVFPFDFSPQCISQSISSSEIGVVPEENSNWMSEVSNLSYSKSSSSDSSSAATAATQPLPLSGIARAARVMRYREKRKNRRFDKTVRYASRKAYAETRPRIKGRFVKRDRTDGDADGEEEQIYAAGAGGFILDDPGVVPLF